MTSNLWERQPCDTDVSFRAYQSYRDQFKRPRQLPMGAVPYVQVLAWYREHNWRERVEAFDKHEDSIRLEARRENLVAQETVRAEKIQGALDDGLEIIAKELERYAALARKSTDLPGGPMKMGELNKLAELVLKWQQILAGKPTEHVKTDIDMGAMTPEEKRELVNALAKATSRKPGRE
jgi:hypothetical protein